MVTERDETSAAVEQRSSVKVTLNAKGEAQVEVKVYAGEDETELERARSLAVDVFRRTVSEVGGGGHGG